MKHVLLFALLFFSAGTAAAQTERPQQLSQAYSCRPIQDVAERAACYDRAIDELMAAEQQGEFVAVDRGRVEAAQRESFGFNLPSISSLIPRIGGGGSIELEALELQVERVVTLPDGRRMFVMTDGQRWTQVEAQRSGNVRAGDAVTVRRAAVGTFMLVSERGGAGHHVRRQN
jgi:hypothetical protein